MSPARPLGFDPVLLASASRLCEIAHLNLPVGGGLVIEVLLADVVLVTDVVKLNGVLLLDSTASLELVLDLLALMRLGYGSRLFDRVDSHTVFERAL